MPHWTPDVTTSVQFIITDKLIQEANSNSGKLLSTYMDEISVSEAVCVSQKLFYGVSLTFDNSVRHSVVEYRGEWDADIY